MIHTNKIWLVNAALAIISLFVGIKTIDLWVGDPFEYENKGARSQEKISYNDREAIKKRVLPESEYEAVVRDNLFCPDRKEITEPEKPETVIPIEVAPPKVVEIIPEVEELKIDDRNVVLYGVMIMDNFTGALVNNFAELKPRKKQKWVKKGETIGDLKLEDVKNDRVIFSKEENGVLEKYAVLLFTKNKGNDEPPVNGRKDKNEPQPKVLTTSAPSNSNNGNSGTADAVDSDEYEIIKTPFGNFKRKKKK